MSYKQQQSEQENRICFYEQSDENFVSIEIPILNIQKENIIRKETVKYIENYFQELTNVNFELCQTNSWTEEYNINVSELCMQYENYIGIESRISLQSEECISIIFEDMMNNNSAAHPLNLFFTYNINPKTGARILFKDRYCISDNLYEKVLTYITESVLEENSGI